MSDIQEELDEDSQSWDWREKTHVVRTAVDDYIAHEVEYLQVIGHVIPGHYLEKIQERVPLELQAEALHKYKAIF